MPAGRIEVLSDYENQIPIEADPIEVHETAMLSESEAAETGARPRRRMAGDRFGRYRILKTLGEGAMGSVYLALDTQLNRKVALKIPKVDAEADTRFIERFLREARSAATLSHPNICPVYDVGEIEGTHFISMAYVQGHPLSDFVNPDKPQRDRNVAYVVRRIALALHEAHINGLVHRDVKPANIMIDQRNEPIIMDFGLARQMDDADARLTRDGAILGSPAYMSPEQIEGDVSRIGPASDIYSLGVILYELLTGQLPYQGTVASIIGQIVSKDPPHPKQLRPDVDLRLAEICLKAMAREVEDRYRSMREFADVLGDYLKAKPGKDKKPQEPMKRSRRKKPVAPKPTTDTNAGLEVTSAPMEVVCLCGQRLKAKRELAGKRVACPRCNDIVTLPDAKAAALTRRHIVVACKQCSQRFLARDELTGKAVRCPVCSRPLTVPKPGEVQPMLPPIDVTCSCGQQFVARPDLAGKRVKCTRCGRPLQVPKRS